MTLTELNSRFGIENALSFEVGPGGLVHALIATPLAEADLCLQGAHVAQWTPRGQRPVLFMSSRSLFAPGKPIRGGVPVIFPWFGARSDGKPGPAHGYARTSEWEVESTRSTEGGGVEVVLALSAQEGISIRFTATFGAELGMSLEVTNGGSEDFRYEEALHTYFSISDIERISVAGLEGSAFIDKTDGFQKKMQPNEPIRIAKETDQVHLDTTATCSLDDPGWQRQIVVAKSGSASTVVWNPWVAKTAGMADMAPDEWKRMVCIETANAADNAVVLRSGRSHRIYAHISVK